MYRRTFMVLVGAAAGCPLAGRAQQKSMPVIGILVAASPENALAQRNLAAFREALAAAGFVEGQTVALEYCWANADLSRLPELAADLVRQKVAVIVTEGGDASAWAAKEATATIPVVFHTAADPVAAGLVASFSRPGGNLTGISLHELDGKRIELTVELLPYAKAIAVLVNPKAANTETMLRNSREAASAKGLTLHAITVESDTEFDAAFATLDRLRPDAVVVVGDIMLFSGHADEVAARIARLRIPAIYSGKQFVEHGGLLSYGSYFRPMYRRKGILAAKILNGANPADLPVERWDQVELAIDFKTAKALGLTLPPTLLIRADEAIE
jgi:putative ABC transport system substrate-binding protein